MTTKINLCLILYLTLTSRQLITSIEKTSSTIVWAILNDRQVRRKCKVEITQDHFVLSMFARDFLLRP